MTTTALIVAAGSGQRAAQDLPKQYTRIGDKTILRLTLETFIDHPGIDHILVVIGRGQEDLFKDSIEGLDGKVSFCTGGKTRQKSVYEGLKQLSSASTSCGKVLIHDAARPFVPPDLISRVIRSLDDHAGVLPVMAVNDTLKRVKGARSLATVDRSGLFLAQTPQGFEFSRIFDAHQRADTQEKITFTDDASIAEWAEMDVHTVEGSAENIKITTREDIERAIMTTRHLIPDIRCGEGFDVHRLGPGDHLTLCGIDIAYEKKLIGHSDADVALHALTDALLGAIASGDIGSHFPPGDAQWRGQSSDRFLQHACKLIADKKGTILSMDVTLICEQPKIGPHRDRMRRRIAEITQTCISRISVKATTTEGLGFTGRKEGIAARASVTVYLGMIE